jgi:serine/threonine protein kinase
MTIQMLADRFEIESQLSCNDFSTVYLACDRRYPHRPACRITAIPYYQCEIRHRLEREAQLLERLGKHPQIPRVLAYFHQAQPSHAQSQDRAIGTFYLVQDHIAGHPLSEEIAPPKKLSESYVNKLLKDVLVALTFAHEQGLVHQNLHPQYLIREARDGQVFVTHFGALSKVARSKIAANGDMSSSIPVGLNPYMAPEQLRSSAESSLLKETVGSEASAEAIAHPQSDLYALGLIAIEALTGQRHHDFIYDPQKGLRWRDDTEVSLPLAEFIDRLIRQDWRDRFPHAKAALATFREQSERDSLERLRHRIAKDSRLATVVAAPGTQITAGTSQTHGRPRSRTSRRTGGLTGNLSRYSRSQPLDPFWVKLGIGSLALVMAFGVSVKAYQWGEYRFSYLTKPWQSWQMPNWQSWRTVSGTYPAAKPKTLTPLLADGSLLLQPAAATAFWQMVSAAYDDNIALYPLAGYSNQADYTTGYALDIGGETAETDRQTNFAQSTTFKWLKRNAKDYGFELSVAKDRRLGIAFSEPWHWRYVGDETSRKVFGL